MTSWQKRLRFVILLAGIACAIAVALAVKRRETVTAAPQLNRADPSASVESIGTVLIRAKGDAPEFRIDGGRYLTYADGRVRIIEGVKVKADKSNGRSFTLTGREADVSADQSLIVVKGDVRLEANDGFVATANDASYSKGEGIIRTEGPATFKQDDTSGSGTGLTYDEPRDVVWILNEAVVNVTGTDQEPLTVRSGAAGMARRDGYLKFTGGVDVESASRRMESDEATAYLSEDKKRIQMIELRGSAHVETTQGGGGALRNMHARDINLAYAPDGRTLQRATLAGTSSVSIAGEAAGQERRLSAELIDIAVGPNGRTVSNITSRDNVEFTMPGSKSSSASRIIRAGSFEAGADGEDGLDHARLLEGVEYRELPAGSAQPRVIKSRELHVRFKAGLIALEEARFVSAVTLEDGGTTATGHEARYLLTRSWMILVGSPELLPHVATPDGAIDAERFELGIDSRTVDARGNVKSVLLPVADAKAGGGRDAKRPHIMKADQAINGMADRLKTDEKNGRATYSGNARVWQVDTSIRADTITMDDGTGDLTASGNVTSTMMLEQTNPNLPRKPKPGVTPEEKPAEDVAAETQKPTTTKTATIAASRELQYDDKTRKVTYKNGAHVVGAQGDLRADKIELYLSEDGERMERAEAYGRVTLRDETRQATSGRLSYHVADERYVLTDNVKVVEECRETTGGTLTFFKSTDTISVESLATRTQTRASSNQLGPPASGSSPGSATGSNATGSGSSTGSGSNALPAGSTTNAAGITSPSVINKCSGAKPSR